MVQYCEPVQSYLWGYLSNEIDEDILACPGLYGYTKHCRQQTQVLITELECSEIQNLDLEEDYDTVDTTLDEGNLSPVCILLALPVVMQLVCDFTKITTNYDQILYSKKELSLWRII